MAATVVCSHPKSERLYVTDHEYVCTCCLRHFQKAAAQIARTDSAAARRLADLIQQAQIRQPGHSELDHLPPGVSSLSVGPRRVMPLARRVYIAGPMSGYADYNFPAFFEAAHRLMTVGYDPINPAETGVHEGWEWSDYLRVSLARLVREAQGVALLPGWEASRGAQLEAYVARTLAMPVKPLETWLAHEEAIRHGG